MLISVEKIAQHLRIDCDLDTGTSAELEAFYDAAIEYACNFCDCELDDLKTDIGELKPSVRQAVLLMIGDFYENREALNDKKLVHSSNTTVERLLHFHRKNMGI